MKVEKKENKVFIIAAVLVLAFSAIIQSYYSAEKAIEHFKKFNGDEISGTIKSVGIGYKGAKFTLEKQSQQYVFYPHTDEQLNGSRIFNYVANKGDSIHKAAYSDTLYLFHNKEVLKYTFQKK